MAAVLTVIFLVVGSLVGVMVVAAVVGLFLRPAHVLARRATIAAAPAAVWAIVTDLDGLVSWRRELKRVEKLAPIDGKPAYREHVRQGAVRFVIDEEVAPAGEAAGRRVTRIADDRLPFDGRWIVTVAPVDGGRATRVTVTEDGRVKNPLFRTMSRTVFSLASMQERWLRALARKAGGGEVAVEPAEPQR